MSYDFEAAQREWSRIPVDDVGYLDAERLLDQPDEDLRAMVGAFETVRYQGWRNAGGVWRRTLGLDTTHGKTVLDFGCGMGIEALAFARSGNDVIVCDINDASRRLAERVLELCGHRAVGSIPALGEEPWFTPDRPIDIFYSNGVLHHTPHLPQILGRARDLLAPGGEVRLMLYSDRAWYAATGSEAPAGDPRKHSDFEAFLRHFDEVGNYAEPWWREKLASQVLGRGLRVREWHYLPEGGYATAVLTCA